MGLKIKHLPALYNLFRTNKKAGKILAAVLIVLFIALMFVAFLAYKIVAGVSGYIIDNAPAVSGLAGEVPMDRTQIEGLFMGSLDWFNGVIDKYGSLLELIGNF